MDCARAAGLAGRIAAGGRSWARDETSIVTDKKCAVGDSSVECAASCDLAEWSLISGSHAACHRAILVIIWWIIWWVIFCGLGSARSVSDQYGSEFAAA